MNNPVDDKLDPMIYNIDIPVSDKVYWDVYNNVRFMAPDQISESMNDWLDIDIIFNSVQ